MTDAGGSGVSFSPDLIAKGKKPGVGGKKNNNNKTPLDYGSIRPGPSSSSFALFLSMLESHSTLTLKPSCLPLSLDWFPSQS